MKTILVTGASGFVARHLIPLLLERGWHVKAAVRNQQTFDVLQLRFSESALRANMTPVVVGEVDGKTEWQRSLEGVAAVVHLAARAHILHDKSPDPEREFFRVNVEGTGNLAEQSIRSGVKRFVFISSIGAMTSLSDEVLDEDSPCRPNTPYGCSKLKAERLLVELAQGSTMAWTILRPTLVYGPGNPGNMERLIRLVKSGFPLPFGGVRNRRSFLFVGNLVDAIVAGLERLNAVNRVFLVSDGEDLSTPDLIRRIAEHMNCPARLLPVPSNLLKMGGWLGDFMERIALRPFVLNGGVIERLLGSLAVDSRCIRTSLNWFSPFTVDEGLSLTVGQK